MIIFAIDPGAKESGYVRWATETQQVVDKGVVPNAMLLDMVNLMRGKEQIAIETIRGYGIVSGDDTFDTCIWIGRFDPDCTALLIPRKEIKRHLCGNTTTNDKYVRMALIGRFGEPGTKRSPGKLYGVSGHVWSALAVAVVATDMMHDEDCVSA